MQFTVRFSSLSERAGNQYVVQVNDTDTGLIGVNIIRATLGKPDLPLEVIRGSVSGLWEWDVEVTVPEPIVQANADLWLRRNTVKVNIPKASLNAYVAHRVKHEVDKDGIIVDAWREPYVNEQLALKDWIEAGMPLKWTPQRKKEATKEGE